MKFDIYMGSIRGYHTYRIETLVNNISLEKWLSRGYIIETEYKVSNSVCEVYLIKN